MKKKRKVKTRLEQLYALDDEAYDLTRKVIHLRGEMDDIGRRIKKLGDAEYDKVIKARADDGKE